jgi:cobalt-zinc-cadmium resistance protein CzcA
MISGLLSFSLRQRVLVLGLAGLLFIAGVYAFHEIPIDAFPDVTPIQVMVVAQVPGQSPVEVERFVTIPIEIQLMGVPDLVELRSVSKFGLMQTTAVFEDSVDIYFARQVVLERLIEVKPRLPARVEPVMMPVATGLEEVYQYYLALPNRTQASLAVSDLQLMDMRTVQEWVIRPLLKGTPGVIEVNSLGGFVKQYQVVVDPAKLRKYSLSLREVFDAIARNNLNTGGNILERQTEKYIVRGIGLIQTLSDIERIVVKEEHGTPVFVRDVARVQIGHAVRHGAALVNGHEAVAGIVLMLRGSNAREVVQAIKDKVDDIHQRHVLPDGFRIVPFYDRIELITAALSTVNYALLEGIVLLILVSLPFLGNLRGAFIVTCTLILTPLVTFLIMRETGLTANLMSLGGLAIAIGEIADGSIVVVENVYHYLSASAPAAPRRRDIVLRAVREVGRPTAFGILIIIVVYLPLITLQGLEGKMFRPLAYTMVTALLVSLVLSLTLSPVLCSLFLRGGREEDLAVLRGLKGLYRPVLLWALTHRGLVVAAAMGLFLVSLALLPFLGREFIPIMDEGALTPQIIRHPSVSLSHSIALERQAQQAIREFPETVMVVSKIGRPEIATTLEEPYESDPVVTLRPRETWTTADRKTDLVEAMRRRLADIPGISVLMSQPIQERLDELISGYRTEVSVKLFGDDLESLTRAAEQMTGIMKTVAGVRDVKMEQQSGQTYLAVTIDREKIARHGINVEDIQDIIATAIGGRAATQVYEAERRFDLTLRFPQDARDTAKAIGNILVRDPTGIAIPLGDLATIELREGPAHISREHLKRRIAVGFNVVERDVGSVVAEAQRKVADNLRLPAGYTVIWSGAFESMQRAMARLQIVTPITIALIFLLLFISLNSLRYAALILLNLPLALIGGVWALWLTGEYLSVPASLGFISLFGVAVGNGLVLVTYIDELRQKGCSLEEAVMTGCLRRLRPVIMTTLTTLVGLFPLAVAQGIGAEVQRPLAVVVLGGMLTSTLLTLVVLPSLFHWFEDRPSVHGAEHPEDDPFTSPIPHPPIKEVLR